MISFERHPDHYRHWRLTIDGAVATLELAVDPDAALAPGYELKANSYDLGVDIELADAVTRLRFEHPEVGCVVITGGLEGATFCAGANIRMLAASAHGHKVNFCKFTNETRCGIEEASALSGQRYLAAVNGAASGGGYELALACDHILLVDDRSSAVSLPEVPLLGVLPGTGGLTRVTDKRRVRRDRADWFATRPEGLRGRDALDWGLVDELAPRSRWAEAVAERAAALAAVSGERGSASGITLGPLRRPHRWVRVEPEPERRLAILTVMGPEGPPPTEAAALDADSWLIAAARELDDALLHLRFNEPELGTLLLRTEGDPELVIAHEARLAGPGWAERETRLLWRRVLKRLDLTARTIIAAVEPTSCFAGTLAELALAADRSFMLDDPGQPTEVVLTEANEGWYPMANALTRLETRFLGGQPPPAGRYDPAKAAEAGLVTFTPDDIDWDDELRLAVEERAAMSPDALTGLEANCRFPGPETMETKIFARLSAWQNWIFIRPNASGEQGALRRYGTGARPDYDFRRT